MKFILKMCSRAFYLTRYPLWIKVTLVIVAAFLLYPLFAPSVHRYSSYWDMFQHHYFGYEKSVIGCNPADW